MEDSQESDFAVVAEFFPAACRTPNS